MPFKLFVNPLCRITTVIVLFSNKYQIKLHISTDKRVKKKLSKKLIYWYFNAVYKMLDQIRFINTLTTALVDSIIVLANITSEN